MSVRLESTGLIAHASACGEFTLCGIMYSTTPQLSTFRIVGATLSNDPVDCMGCLVQATRGPIDRVAVHVTTTLRIPIVEMTFVMEPDE